MPRWIRASCLARCLAGFLAAFPVFAPLAAAQTPPAEASAPAAKAAPPPPRCADKIYHQFDFWIGAWDVFDAKGKKVGESQITQEEAGCLIVEHWTSATGNNGQSYNVYDPAKKAWRQLWISPFEETDYSGALNDKGEMVLLGVSQMAGGTKQKSRGVWTANPDGTVRQRFWDWDADKKAWRLSFDGRYKKKA